LLPIDFLNNATDINPTTLVSGSGAVGNVFALPDWEKQSALLSHLTFDVVKA